ncbi:MAG: hypothetical protein D6701_08020 [Gemmatimonadetes bacterium]|nr:MAG: hypothetical protein D6701_08020 [Gemmatimonadota bacterium]
MSTLPDPSTERSAASTGVGATPPAQAPGTEPAHGQAATGGAPPPAAPARPLEPPTTGQRVATISHEGRFWDVFLEFRDDPHDPNTYRGLLCFCPLDMAEGEEPVRTTTIIIESTYDEAVRKAHRFEDHQLQGLLRSALPD